MDIHSNQHKQINKKYTLQDVIIFLVINTTFLKFKMFKKYKNWERECWRMPGPGFCSVISSSPAIGSKVKKKFTFMKLFVIAQFCPQLHQNELSIACLGGRDQE